MVANLSPRLIAPASTGNGDLHSWILDESRNLLLDGYSGDEVEQLLVEAANNKGRSSATLVREVQDAVRGAVRWLEENPDHSHHSQHRHHLKDRDRRANQEWLPGWLVADLREADGHIYPRDSREKHLPLNERKQQWVLHRFGRFKLQDFREDSRNKREEFSYWDLFAEIDFPICCAREVNMPITEYLSKWLLREDRKQMFAQQFVVPNPMLRVGMGGRFKCDDNTGRRTYLIVEFDFKDESIPLLERLDKQARLLYYLRDRWPLAMIVYSGSKSLHGWFVCFHKSEHQIRTFFRQATELGADRAMWVPSQYSRMPWGINRKTSRRQAVIYYDREIIEAQNKLVRKECL